jgi:hypothetical protein
MNMRHLWSRWFDRRPNRQQMHLARAVLFLTLGGLVALILSRFL